MLTLHYRAGTPLGDRFPLVTFGRFATAETAEAVRLRCPNHDQIEVTQA